MHNATNGGQSGLPGQFDRLPHEPFVHSFGPPIDSRMTASGIPDRSEDLRDAIPGQV
jgi:hypothetical protein